MGSMAPSTYLLVGAFLPFVVSGQTLVESFRGEIRSCETACGKSYPGEGEEQVRLFSFCRSGCRLLNVVDVLDGFNNLNDPKLACFKCCQDSYSIGQNIGACKFGCESQVASAERRRQKIEEYCYSQQVDSLSPTLYISSIFSNMIEDSNDRVSRSYYTQTLNGGLVVVAASSSLVSAGGENSYEDDSLNYMEMRGMLIGSLVDDVPSLSNDPSPAIANEPGENNVALKSDVILHTCVILRTGVSRLLASCLFIFFLLLIVWIWTSAPATVVTKQDRKLLLLLEKQDLKHLQCFDDTDQLQVFVGPSSDDVKAGPPPPPPPQCATSDAASGFKPMELIDVGSPFPLKSKVETV